MEQKFLKKIKRHRTQFTSGQIATLYLVVYHSNKQNGKLITVLFSAVFIFSLGLSTTC